MRRLRKGVAISVACDQFPARDQVAQARRQFPALVAARSQFAHQLLVSGRLPRLALYFLENGGIGKHVNVR
jgi:hypothetical protein